MGTAVAPTPQAQPPATLDGILRGKGFKDAVAAALPSHIKPDRFIRIALTAMTRTPKLKECDQGSFFQALLTLSQLGLEPDGRRAHLIPFNNSKRGCVECNLIIDYKGIVELVMRSGKVSFIHADVVCENDDFAYDRGEIKKHIIDLKKPRGNVYAAYSFVRFKDHTEKCEVMSREEIEAIRKRSRAGNSGPWVTDWNEMAKKTVFRRLSKWVELSPELREAVEADDDQFGFNATDTVASLPSTVTLDDLAQITSNDEVESQDNGHATEDESQEPAESKKPAGNGKSLVGKQSPAWAAFMKEHERVGASVAISVKDKSELVNKAFDKLNTDELVAFTAELAKINPDAE